MKIKIPSKFADLHLDLFITKVFNNLKQNPADSYQFDFTECEWIAHQELLVITSLLKYFVETEIQFELLFFKRGISTREIPRRVALQLIQIWDTWKIWSIIVDSNYIKYFGLDGGAIDRLKQMHNYHHSTNELYSRYGISPFVSLNYIKNYDDAEISEIFSPYYRLNAAISELLKNNKCYHPFVNGTLGSIITKELYENFLDHFSPQVFHSKNNWAFMSLSLKVKLNEESLGESLTQELLAKNFNEEFPSESKSFFYDSKKKKYINQSYIEFSFLDFGTGIPSTLHNQYLAHHKSLNITDINESEQDSQILKYSFRHDTSRHPIIDSYNKRELYIPRGLFDLLSVVLRYKGLIIVRSNRGKILYDFSENKDIDTAFSLIESDNKFFPGTLISVYLPELLHEYKIDSSTIKPIKKVTSYFPPKINYLNLYHIINKIKSEKSDLYLNILQEIRKKIKSDIPQVTYFSFEGYQSDERLTKKIIHFLIADYEININNSIVVLHPPDRNIINDISLTILSLNQVTKNYKIHPLPFVYYNIEDDSIQLVWLGIYNKEDAIKLNDILFDQFSLAKSDFVEPSNIIGQINYFDRHGNLETYFPNSKKLLEYYKEEYKNADTQEVMKIIDENNCLKSRNSENLFLCNANYYQYQFFELIHLLSKQKDCDLVSEILYRRIKPTLSNSEKYLYIGITSISHKILTSFVSQGFIREDEVILLDNYISFRDDERFNNIREGYSCILVCDIIATGYLTLRLSDALKAIGAKLSHVAVVVDTIDENFENSKEFLKKYENKLISITKHKIEKFRRSDKKIKDYLGKKHVTRIDPFTNIPITLSLDETNYNKSVILTSEKFLDFIKEEDIKIGYLKFNNVIHPYFFDTKKIISDINVELLKSIFHELLIRSKNLNIAKQLLTAKELNIFYPKDSGIQNLNFDLLKNEIFKDHSIEKFELERFNTSDGWKFPHTTDYFNQIITGKSVLILDDGSCTGDSLIQMIDEIAFFNVKGIILLCLVGRMNDHRREFFSRVTQLKTTRDNPVRLEIYFASHWHIPTYYLDENPNTKERNWLQDVIDLQNTPEPIKTIARKIQNELQPKSLEQFYDHKYIPKLKDRKLPKKELLIIRNEIGKIIGYRFYKESFIFFDNLIKKYDTNIRTERNKEMELVCSIFLYEPYLYRKVAQVLPDLVDKIEEFVDALIFGNPKRGNKQIDISIDLTYQWNKVGIVHLFFIVFNNEKLFQKLENIQNFKLLMKFVSDTDFTLNYFLFKILYYFPLTREELQLKKQGSLVHQLDIFLQEKWIPNKLLPQVKIFRSFLSTLPSNDDYYSKLSIINENYRKLTDLKLHKNSLLVHYDIMQVDLEVLSTNFNDMTKESFIESWNQLAIFIQDILSFSSNYPTFFLTYHGSVEGNFNNSLRSIHGKLNESINNLNKASDFAIIKQLLFKFKSKFLNTESEMFKIFNKISSTRIEDTIRALLTKEKINNPYIEVDKQVNSSTSVDFPQYLLENYIFQEIITNLRHRDRAHQITIHFKMDGSYLLIVVSNKISNSVNHGGGNGLAMLERLNIFPKKIIQYKHLPNRTDYFTQELRVKKI